MRRTALSNRAPATNNLTRTLRGPVGIYIGSNTPAEIAVSGMAQILAAKNGVNLPKEFSMGNANHSAQALHP